MSEYPFLPTLSNGFDFTSRILGSPGSYGALWRVRVRIASDTSDATTAIQKEYACKIIRQHRYTEQDRIKQEIKLIRRICTTGHPNVVQILSDWREEIKGTGVYLTTMELCSQNYESHLNMCHDRYDFWDWWFPYEPGGGRLLDLILELDIIEGLAFIHSMNGTHRNLTPTNVLLKANEATQRYHCKIADYGFTTLGQGPLTPTYCSPEFLIHNKFSQKSDIWAFGCLLFEACLASLDRRITFSSMTDVTTYYWNETIPPPQISWETMGVNPHSIPMTRRMYLSTVELFWSRLNIILAAVFRRNPDERPDAATLRDNLYMVADGRDPTLVDYRQQPTT